MCIRDRDISQIAGTFEGGLVLLVANIPLDFALYDFASEWSQPGPWFWPLGGGINTAAAVWLVMSNNRLLIYLLNLILSRFSGLKAVTKTAISYPIKVIRNFFFRNFISSILIVSIFVIM